MGEMPGQEQKTFGHEIVISPTLVKARQTLRLIGLGFKLLGGTKVGLGPLLVALGLIGRRATCIGLGIVRIEIGAPQCNRRWRDPCRRSRRRRGRD